MYCNTCDYEFDDGNILDKTSHDDFHKRFELACTELGYKPRGAYAREELQRKALLHLRSKDIGSQMRGAILIFRKHYDLSVHAAIIGGYFREHPDFETYISMICGSCDEIPPVIKTTLIEEYGLLAGVIAPGCSTWYPENFEERHRQFEEYDKRAVIKVDTEGAQPLPLLTNRKLSAGKNK